MHSKFSTPIAYFRVFVVLCSIAALTACSDNDVSSAVEKLPMPQEYEANKDLTVKPGDSFYNYCNGTWLQNNPIPSDGSIGGIFSAGTVMQQRLEQLKKDVTDIGHFYYLVEHAAEQTEQAEAYIEARKAETVKPSTKEEAYAAIGRLIMEGLDVWSNPQKMGSFLLVWDKGQFKAMLIPPVKKVSGGYIEESELVPLSKSRAGGESSPQTLIAKAMGIDASLLYTTPDLDSSWKEVEQMSLDELYQYMVSAWDQFKDIKEADAKVSVSYTQSYHFAQKFLSESFKNKFLGYTKQIQASLRKRIMKADWMSETTKNNAIEKLDHYGLFVAYPDKWYTDCVASLADCQTLVEAYHRNQRGITHLRTHLAGTSDVFSYELVSVLVDSNNNPVPSDLTLVNAMYSPEHNCVLIYPAMLLPPFMPEDGYCEAVYYAAFSAIGHEFTHGFDSNGSKYDLYGKERNWWTVADRMAFEERCQNIINCYSHLEMEPGVEGRSGVYGDGDRTQTENIADLGGFLTALDAYQAHLDEQGFTGEARNEQLRKFYEAYAHQWCVQYDDTKFNILKTTDIHSHGRLRVNGVVMNTDMWYDLYNVERNNLLYLPKDRRAYIW